MRNDEWLALSDDELAANFEELLYLGPQYAAHSGALRIAHRADPDAVRVALDHLARVVETGRRQRRTCTVVEFLGLARVPEAVPPLIRLLALQQGEQGFVRWGYDCAGTLDALGRIGTEAAVDELVVRAKEWATDLWPHAGPERFPFNWCVGCASGLVEALSRHPEPRCLDALLGMVGARSTSWGGRAMHALAKVADERFEPFFIEVSAVTGGSNAALSGIARVGTRRSGGVLHRYLREARNRRERYRVVRAAAAVAARDPGLRFSDFHGDGPAFRRDCASLSGWRETRERLYGVSPSKEPDGVLRARRIRAYGRACTAATVASYRIDPRRELVAALDDPYYRVRANAANALGRVGLPHPDDELHLRHAARYDPVPCVRDAAQAALREVFRVIRPGRPDVI